MYLLFQFAGSAGGEVGVNEAVDITVHHGGDVAVCPNGCASRRGPRELNLRGRSKSALAPRFCLGAKRLYAASAAVKTAASPPYFFSSPVALAVR